MDAALAFTGFLGFVIIICVVLGAVEEENMKMWIVIVIPSKGNCKAYFSWAFYFAKLILLILVYCSISYSCFALYHKNVVCLQILARASKQICVSLVPFVQAYFSEGLALLLSDWTDVVHSLCAAISHLHYQQANTAIKSLFSRAHVY